MSLGNDGPGWLFCPADRPERFEKAAAAADVVILDLEDGVAAKDREAAREALIASRLDPQRTVVRISPSATADHINFAIWTPWPRTDYTVVMLAKTESPRQVRDLAPREVIVLIETPLGALEVGELARMENAFAVMWGAEDLFAVTGGTANRWPDGSYRDVARHVRSQSLLAAKAYGKMALDSVYLNIKDLDGLRAESDDAVAVGFDAKVAIHPTQVAVHPRRLRADRRSGRLGEARARHGTHATRRLPIRRHNGGCPECCGGQSASSRWRPTPAADGQAPHQGFVPTASVLSTSVA